MQDITVLHQGVGLKKATSCKDIDAQRKWFDVQPPIGPLLAVH